MKYVVFSFDDGHRVFLTRTLPILNQYGIPGVVNIVADIAERSGKIDDVAQRTFMSWEDINKCRQDGIEIANHAAGHTNKLEDIIRGEELIRTHLGTNEKIGFASPNSGVCKANFAEYKILLDRHTAYIRSGNMLKRDGWLHLLLYLAYKYTGLAKIFYWYNKRNVIMLDQKIDFFPSVTCNRDNTVEQIIYFIEKMPDESACVIMFHSILAKEDTGYGKGKWTNTVEEFDLLCQYLSQKEDIAVITHKALCDLMDNT